MRLPKILLFWKLLPRLEKLSKTKRSPNHSRLSKKPILREETKPDNNLKKESIEFQVDNRNTERKREKPWANIKSQSKKRNKRFRRKTKPSKELCKSSRKRKGPRRDWLPRLLSLMLPRSLTSTVPTLKWLMSLFKESVKERLSTAKQDLNKCKQMSKEWKLSNILEKSNIDRKSDVKKEPCKKRPSEKRPRKDKKKDPRSTEWRSKKE